MNLRLIIAGAAFVAFLNASLVSAQEEYSNMVDYQMESDLYWPGEVDSSVYVDYFYEPIYYEDSSSSLEFDTDDAAISLPLLWEEDFEPEIFEYQPMLDAYLYDEVELAFAMDHFYDPTFYDVLSGPLHTGLQYDLSDELWQDVDVVGDVMPNGWIDQHEAIGDFENFYFAEVAVDVPNNNQVDAAASHSSSGPDEPEAVAEDRCSPPDPSTTNDIVGVGTFARPRIMTMTMIYEAQKFVHSQEYARKTRYFQEEIGGPDTGTAILARNCSHDVVLTTTQKSYNWNADPTVCDWKLSGEDSETLSQEASSRILKDLEQRLVETLQTKSQFLLESQGRTSEEGTYVNNFAFTAGKETQAEVDLIYRGTKAEFSAFIPSDALRWAAGNEISWREVYILSDDRSQCMHQEQDSSGFIEQFECSEYFYPRAGIHPLFFPIESLGCGRNDEMLYDWNAPLPPVGAANRPEDFA